MKQFLIFYRWSWLFAFYKLYDIYAATMALIVATAIVLDLQLGSYRKVEKWLHYVRTGGRVRWTDAAFSTTMNSLKWKVTVIYALFAGALLISQWAMKKPLIQRMLGKEPTLPQEVWSV